MRSHCLPGRAALLMAAAGFAFWACALPHATRPSQNGRGVRAVRTDGDHPHDWIEERYSAAAQADAPSHGEYFAAAAPLDASLTRPCWTVSGVISARSQSLTSAIFADHPYIRPPPCLS